VYVARVYDVQSKRRVSRSFASLADARRWRAQQAGLAARGVRLVGTPETLHEAAEAFLEGIRSGAIRSKRGAPYKPSAVRSYEQALRLHLLPILGGAKLARIQRRDIQQVVDGMLAAGSRPSTVRNALNPLQAIYRRAVQDGDLATNPCDHLRLPATQNRRPRIADPEEAELLLAALPADRALWAAAFYTGCRMGELRALAWEHVDFDAGVILSSVPWTRPGR
jgi:integrase